MKMNRRFAGRFGVMAIVVLTSACTSPPAETPPQTTAPAAAPAPAAPAYTPVVSLNEIMVYVVDTHSNEIWDAAMSPPKTDAQWRDLNRAAVTLAAAGSLTKMSGNGPNDQKWTAQADWTTFSQAVSDAGLAAMRAVSAKDTAALSKAGDQLVLSCINCHREYRLDVPKIWTERQLPPEEQR